MDAYFCVFRTKDNLYFGRYWPWSADPKQGDIVPPEFMDGHIRVFGVGSRSNFPWALALISMSLLFPKKASSNRRSWSEEEWEKMVINMPTLDSKLCEKGTLVVLDTGETSLGNLLS